MTEPLVSVCIPTRNGARFLEHTIRSVLEQTHRNLRIIVSDDASTDGTMTIVERLRDERFVVLPHDSPSGAAGNWNAVCAAAEGDYIKLLCQDDVLMAGCIEHQVAALEARPECSFCWSPRDVISPGGRRLLRSRGFVPASPVVHLADAVTEVVRSGTNPFGEPCAVLVRHEAFLATGRFHGEYLIDLGMWLALLGWGPAVHLNRTLSQFRIAPSSWTAALKGRHAEQFLECARELAAAHPDVITAKDLVDGERNATRLQRQRTALVALLKLCPI